MSSAPNRLVEVQEQGQLKEYKEVEWYEKNSWIKVDDSGTKVDLPRIAHYINKGWNDRADFLESNLEGAKLKNRRELSVMEFDIEFEEVEEADDYSKKGGDTISPSMFAVSFPGKERGVLFRVLSNMQLKNGDNGDFHAMNDNAKETGGQSSPYPKEWVEVFSSMDGWNQMGLHLQKLGVSRFRRNKFKKGKTAPEWFTEHWGPSAFHVAKTSAEKGSGVIVFKSWWAYDTSPWCKLEFLFCKCLAKKFPNSVYVVTGYDAEEDKTSGYFMQGNEEF